MLEILNKEITDTDYIGLSSHEAAVRLKEGKNVLASDKKSSCLKLFFNQFRDFLVMILLGATAVSVLLGEIWDAATIMVILLVNALLGFIQEVRTERTLTALSKMAAPHAEVFRDGVLKTIPAEEVVRGDVFSIKAGDIIPADAVILSQNRLLCDEAILTGESISVPKTEYGGEADDKSLNLPYMVYMGCVAASGNAVCRVTAIGRATQTGKLSGLIESVEDEETPLQKRLARLGRTLGIICLAVCVVVFLAGIISGEDVFLMLMTGLTVAIAAIPEGLPATVTVALALAVRRILKRGALVNRLHSVETLGSATVICTDKTGTVTQNKMTVTRMVTADGELEATGTGYGVAGEILRGDKKISADEDSELLELLRCFAICNNASIARQGAVSERDRGAEKQWNASGDSAEAALLVAAAKAGVLKEKLAAHRVSEIPFDARARMMTVFVDSVDGADENAAYTKGSAETVIALCGYIHTLGGILPLDEAYRRRLTEKSEELAAKGLRVFAFSKALDDKIIFLGLAAMEDAVNVGVPEAVAACKRGGIRVMMLTGDHKLTACAVAKKAGILKQENEAVTGAELDKMTDEELLEVLHEKSVFARVTPEHKLRIVRALKASGEIVAMTGDGVNDAPAVKEASIGVAMGKNGTDVTKAAADLILLDDNFGTIASAVKEGRGIYANLRKLVRYLISCNIGEVISMLFGIIIGLPPILVPTQILLVNLVTDGLPAIALGLEPTDDEVMNESPKNDKSFFSNGLMPKIIFRGIFIGLCTLGAFVSIYNFSGDVTAARCSALITLVISQLIYSVECKSETKKIFKVRIFDNPFLILSCLLSLAVLILCIAVPPLAVVFEACRLSVTQLAISLAFAAAPTVIGTIVS